MGPAAVCSASRPPGLDIGGIRVLGGPRVCLYLLVATLSSPQRRHQKGCEGGGIRVEGSGGVGGLESPREPTEI